MMRQYELVERVQRYKPDVNEALLNKAYVYAMQKHGHQQRASGDPYFSHPLEVAAILTDMHIDEATIAVALLHDTIEDTDRDPRRRSTSCSAPDIGKLVEGLTKLKKLDLVSKKAEQAENLRKLLLAISEDVRVLLVKLADRLHNMRTLDHMPQDKRAAHRRGDDGDLCAAGRPHGHAGHARGAGGAGLPPHQSGGLPHRHRAAGRNVRAQHAASSARSRRRCRRCSRSTASRPTVKSRQKKPWSVFRKMEAEGAVLRAALRHLRLPRRRRHGRGLLPRARRHPHDLVDGSRPLQGLHLDAEAERLPLDPHHHRRPVAPARRAADPHPAR